MNSGERVVLVATGEAGIIIGWLGSDAIVVLDSGHTVVRAVPALRRAP
jgi:hypothetical protein